MTSAELQYIVKVNDRDLKELKTRIKDINSAFSDSEKAGSKWGSKMQGLGKAAKVAGLGIGVAAGGLAWALKKSVEAAMEAEQIQAQTEAVIKSTGKAANVTAKQVEGLAGAIASKSGIDDEAIQKGQNMLLTFTNVRNEVGKGKDIFNQATQTLADMSVAMGTDMSKQAIQLGRALNDPLKGVGALSRVGVTFTASQKEAIKAMVELGDTAGAQKIVLQELQKEFGGSAEAAGKTMAGQLNIAKVAVGDLAENVGAKLLPSFTSALQWANQTWPKISGHVDKAGKIIADVIGEIVAFVQNHLVPIFKRIAEVARIYWGAVSKVFTENEAEIRNILGGLKTLIQTIATVLLFLADKVVIPIIKPLFATVLPLALGFTLKAISAIVDIISALKTGFLWFKDNAVKIWNGIKIALVPIFNALETAFRPVMDIVGRILSILQSIPEAVEKVKAALGKLGSIASSVGGLVGKVPGLASGGPVSAGQAYIVGERGPELFLPNSSGTIIPNNALGTPRGLSSAGGATNVYITVEGSVVSEFDLAQTVRNELLRVQTRNLNTGLV